MNPSEPDFVFDKRPTLGAPLRFRGRSWVISAIAPGWLTLTDTHKRADKQPNPSEIASARWVLS